MEKIELSNINLNFNNKQVLNNFSLTFSNNDKILISGNSGKGKSTIIKILLGFQKFGSGRYNINSKSFEEYNIFEVRKMFAYVDQEVSLRKISAKQYLQDIAKFSGNSLNGVLNEQLCEYFEFDLNLLDKDIQKLSGGERQRLAIIISIMLKRPFFLLDEITSSLDKNLKEKTVSYFSSCPEGVISISHDEVWLNNSNFKKVIL